jgi:hypothetical protein
LRKLKVELPYDPDIALLVMYPEESVSAHYKDNCMRILITVLLKIAKLRNQSKVLING